MLFWLGLIVPSAIDVEGTNTRYHTLLIFTANALIWEMLGDALQWHLQHCSRKSQAFANFFEISEFLFSILDQANSWSLEEVLLGSGYDDDVVLCHRKLQY